MTNDLDVIIRYWRELVESVSFEAQHFNFEAKGQDIAESFGPLAFS
jgi:hypothetical protein